MSIPVTLVGRIGNPPELKFSNSGQAVARFSVVTSRRQLNKTTNEWEDTDTTWWNCTAFGQLAENIAESLDVKGIAVIVTGRAATETWDDKNTGEKRTAVKVIADEVAPSLRWAIAKVAKANRQNGQGGGQQSSGNQGQQGRPNQQQGQQSGGWGGQTQGSGWGQDAGRDDNPPF